MAKKKDTLKSLADLFGQYDAERIWKQMQKQKKKGGK